MSRPGLGRDHPAAVQQRCRRPPDALRDLDDGGVDGRNIRGGGFDGRRHATDQRQRHLAGVVLHPVHAGGGLPRHESIRRRRRGQLQEGGLLFWRCSCFAK